MILALQPPSIGCNFILMLQCSVRVSGAEITEIIEEKAQIMEISLY
jgi:hypothetical protein